MSHITQIAYDTYVTGPGKPLLMLMLLAVGTFLLGYIASASNRGDIANLIAACGVFGAILVVANQVWDTIIVVVKAIGL